jgi:hypothetical protein
VRPQSSAQLTCTTDPSQRSFLGEKKGLMQCAPALRTRPLQRCRKDLRRTLTRGRLQPQLGSTVPTDFLSVTTPCCINNLRAPISTDFFTCSQAALRPPRRRRVRCGACEVRSHHIVM